MSRLSISKLKLPCQGSKFVVAMVANATMFSNLLPDAHVVANICYCHKCLVLLILIVLCLLCDPLHNLRRPQQICCGNSIYSRPLSVLFSLRKKCRYNFATTKLVLLPGLAPGSKGLLPPKKMNF